MTCRNEVTTSTGTLFFVNLIIQVIIKAQKLTQSRLMRILSYHTQIHIYQYSKADNNFCFTNNKNTIGFILKLSHNAESLVLKFLC